MFTNYYERQLDNESRECTVTVNIKAKARQSILKTRKSRNAFIRHLQDQDLMHTYGCDCYHCSNDWDCCGRYTVQIVSLRAWKKGVIVRYTMSRNL